MPRKIGCAFPLSSGEECAKQLRLIETNGAGDVLPEVLLMPWMMVLPLSVQAFECYGTFSKYMKHSWYFQLLHILITFTQHLSRSLINNRELDRHPQKEGNLLLLSFAIHCQHIDFLFTPTGTFCYLILYTYIQQTSYLF